jgi:hypothetical protein
MRNLFTRVAGRVFSRAMTTAILLGASVLFELPARGQNADSAAAIVPAGLDSFNYVIGTETFGPTYQFTKEEPLLETAKAIRALGSNVIKFGLTPKYAGYDGDSKKMGNIRTPNPNIHSLVELARDEPTHHQVLDMPFLNFILWTHTFSNDANWREGFGEDKQKTEYKEIYDLTKYLLTNYSGTGKTFYLGHWEGDGWLRHSVNPKDDVLVTPLKVQGMIDWYNTRQRAVDDAKRDTPHPGVQVWQYAEVNHVKLAMEGRKALVNEVLPHTHVDYVSYSSYDTASDPELLKKALSFIESELPAKTGFTGKRVFIGEFGFPEIRYSPAEQDLKSRHVLQAALQWGCPFALYWEMYNNEIDKRGQLGFWMIDDKGVKQPIYETYKQFYEHARNYVADFIKSNRRPPTYEEYAKVAVKFLDK